MLISSSRNDSYPEVVKQQHKMADDVVVFQKQDFPNDVFPVMEEIRRRGKLCDVTLKIGDRRITAHRIVLAGSIPYFYAMFTHDMVESKQDEISMQGIDASALEALVNFAYSGKIQFDTTNVQAILLGANFLHLQVVKDACCDFLGNRLTANNVLGIGTFADSLMCSTLLESCNKFINKHFVDIVKSDEFLELNIKDLTFILESDELHVSNEEQIFEAAVLWVKSDEKARGEHMPTLLKSVRLPLVTPQYLADTVGREEIIKSCLDCRDLLDEAKDYHLMPERRVKLRTFKTRPRCCSEMVGLIYAVGGLTSSGESVSTVEFYDVVVARWKVAEPMRTLRSRVGIAVLKNKLYAIGGYDGHERLNTVEIFDPETNNWKQVVPMLGKRSALGAAALDDKLYVCGGYDGVTSLRSVECYDAASDKWSPVPQMTRLRSAAGVTAFDGQLYSLGGHDGLNIFDSVECYNNLTDEWKQVAPMLSKRCRLGVAALNGKLYAAGGYDGNVFLKSVECYDPVSNKWTHVAPMNVKRSRVALVANCRKLYAIGGYDGVSNLNSMEVYDPDFNMWTFAASMIAHEGGVGVGVIPPHPPLR